jgi:hypothetical protein
VTISFAQIASHLFGPASGASSSRTWTIETKYYTAQVHVLEFCSITETDAPNVRQTVNIEMKSRNPKPPSQAIKQTMPPYIHNSATNN